MDGNIGEVSFAGVDMGVCPECGRDTARFRVNELLARAPACVVAGHPVVEVTMCEFDSLRGDPVFQKNKGWSDLAPDMHEGLVARYGQDAARNPAGYLCTYAEHILVRVDSHDPPAG
jgi:hypothetical protein